MKTLLSELQPGESAIIFKGEDDQQLGVIRIDDALFIGSQIAVKSVNIHGDGYFDIHADKCPLGEAAEIINKYNSKDWMSLLKKAMVNKFVEEELK